MMLFAEAGFEPTASGVLGPSVRTLHCPAMFSPSYGGRSPPRSGHGDNHAHVRLTQPRDSVLSLSVTALPARHPGAITTPNARCYTPIQKS